MPKGSDHGPSVKDDKLYEELREDGASKEKKRPGSPTRRRAERT